MTRFIPFSRDRSFLLPPDAREWLPADDVAHFVVAAGERVALGAFAVRPAPGGKAQYHPRLLPALLIYAYANGIFSSRRIERATHRDIGVRHVAANLHPDHDTIAAFRRANRAAFEAAFPQVLLLARESGLLRLGTVAIDGSQLAANASRIRSVHCHRAKALRARLAADIAELTARAEAAAAEAQPDPQALPAGIARREALKARLDAACARREAQARAEAAAARPGYEARRAASEAKAGRRGRPPKPPGDDPPATRRSHLTDPDGAPMRRSGAREYRQACTAQAVVCAEGSPLILATTAVATPADAPRFAATILGREGASACRRPSSPTPASPPPRPPPPCRPGTSRRWSPAAPPSPTGPATSAPHPSPRHRAASPNPGASPCAPSGTPTMPKPATPAASRPSSPSSASSSQPSASPASTSAASPTSPPSGP